MSRALAKEPGTHSTVRGAITMDGERYANLYLYINSLMLATPLCTVPYSTGAIFVYHNTLAPSTPTSSARYAPMYALPSIVVTASLFEFNQ